MCVCVFAIVIAIAMVGAGTSPAPCRRKRPRAAVASLVEPSAAASGARRKRDRRPSTAERAAGLPVKSGPVVEGGVSTRDLHVSSEAPAAAGALHEEGSCVHRPVGRSRVQGAGGGKVSSGLAGLSSCGLLRADGGGALTRDLPAVLGAGAATDGAAAATSSTAASSRSPLAPEAAAVRLAVPTGRSGSEWQPRRRQHGQQQQQQQQQQQRQHQSRPPSLWPYS